MSCACVAAFNAFYACLSMPGQTFMSCATSNQGLLTSLPSSDLPLLEGCGLACSSACGVMLPTDGGEGGTTESGGGEGGTDSGGG